MTGVEEPRPSRRGPAPARRGPRRLAEELAGTLGEPAAVAWIHAAALTVHAAHAGRLDLADQRGSDPASAIRANVDRLAHAHPLLASLLDPAVTPIWQATPSREHAAAVMGLWHQHHHQLVPDPLRPDGYHVGDLYQAIATRARRDRALCQTPRFVTDLLLDCTLPNALEVWGLEGLRLLDPACGTGHMLVEAFLRAWAGCWQHWPRRGDQVLVALDAVHGVDVDPYAALVARYRLLVLTCGILRTPLQRAPRDLPVHVAVADALLDQTEPLLARGRYHVVVANPPYVTCKDPAKRAAIRTRWRQVCTGQFSLAVPFEPLMHELCVAGGWVGRITTNSFTKREFGRKLVEDYLPTVDLRWVIDTSGAYIPGHGTPTVILISRNQPPQDARVRAVLGTRGEPRIPADPATGLVWSAIACAVRERESLDRLARAFAAAGATRHAADAEPARQADPAGIVHQPRLADLLEPVA